MMAGLSSTLETLEEDTYGFWVDFARCPGGNVTEVNGVRLFRTGVSMTSYNGAAGTADDVDGTLAEMRAWDLPARWLTCSRARQLETSLAARGLALLDEWPGMVAPIESLAEPNSNGIETEVVRNESQFDTWADIFADAFGLSPEVANLVKRAHAWPSLHQENRTYLMFRRDGAMVATGLLRSTPGVAGIYGIAVLRAFRKQGLGTMATLLTAREGIRRGARLAVLQATKEGFPVYEKLGFQTICSFRSWHVA